jgi:transposase-like protein
MVAFEPAIIVCAVRWYLRFPLSYRDVEELIMEAFRPHHHLEAVKKMVRKDRMRWLPKGDILGQIQFIRKILGLKAA